MVIHNKTLKTNKISLKERKRLQRCGICGPCLISKDCLTCNNCVNRAKGKQACKLRKCQLILQIQSTRKQELKGGKHPKNRAKPRKVRNFSMQKKYLCYFYFNLCHYFIYAP